MKKILLALTVIMFTCMCANAQNIIQITQNGNSSNVQNDCGFKINGICSSEDIGGVSLEGLSRDVYGSGPWANGITNAELKNYNNFTVTVLIKFLFDSYSQGGATYEDEVYQVVIPSNETKKVQLKRGNCPSCYSLQGMIVRRLGN
ncbi:MAG: hypothetical protein IJK62_03335 [Bacteroidales bacterium]|nr:hypothetical protein [Bacteroidales bacterium]